MIKKFAVRPRNFRCDLSIATATLIVVASGLNILPYTTVSERFVVNTTPSMPVGVYRITDRPIVKGAIIGACVPESYATLAKSRDYLGSGSCPSGLRPVMKHVAAVAGDEIAISAKEVLLTESRQTLF